MRVFCLDRYKFLNLVLGLIQGWLQSDRQLLQENTQLSNYIESEVKVPICIAINPISIAIMRRRAIPKDHNFLVLTLLSTPPDRGWQRNEDLLLLHSFLSLDIFCSVFDT